jgi:NADPH-dependent curcumin reductase CurA
MTHATVISHHMTAMGWNAPDLHRALLTHGLEASRVTVYNWAKGDARPTATAWAALIEVLAITDHEVLMVAKTAGGSS